MSSPLHHCVDKVYGLLSSQSLPVIVFTLLPLTIHLVWAKRRFQHQRRSGVAAANLSVQSRTPVGKRNVKKWLVIIICTIRTCYCSYCLHLHQRLPPLCVIAPTLWRLDGSGRGGRMYNGGSQWPLSSEPLSSYSVCLSDWQRTVYR